MSKVKIFLFLQFVFFSALPVFAQTVDTAWVRRYNGPDNLSDYARALGVDNAGNVYVTGVSIDTGAGDSYATIKYSSDGDSLWVRRFKTAVDLTGVSAFAVANSGNVLITGLSQKLVCYSFSPYDLVAIKYAPNGDTAWVRYYNGPDCMTDQGRAIAPDSSGNIYVGGASRSPKYDIDSNIIVDYINHDFITIKYAPDGDTLWTRRYNGPGDSTDTVWDMAIDNAGNVYVTGESWGGGGEPDLSLIMPLSSMLPMGMSYGSAVTTDQEIQTTALLRWRWMAVEMCMCQGMLAQLSTCQMVIPPGLEPDILVLP